MIAQLIENTLANWLQTVGEPASGDVSFRVGPGPGIVVPIRRGADQRDRPELVLVADAVDETFTQDPFPTPNFHGNAVVTFRYPADPVTGIEDSSLAMRQIADQIDLALHRPDLPQRLTEASAGTLYVYGFKEAIIHQMNFDGRYWNMHWRLTLYSCMEKTANSQ